MGLLLSAGAAPRPETFESPPPLDRDRKPRFQVADAHFMGVPLVPQPLGLPSSRTHEWRRPPIRRQRLLSLPTQQRPAAWVANHGTAAPGRSQTKGDAPRVTGVHRPSGINASQLFRRLMPPAPPVRQHGPRVPSREHRSHPLEGPPSIRRDSLLEPHSQGPAFESPG